MVYISMIIGVMLNTSPQPAAPLDINEVIRRFTEYDQSLNEGAGLSRSGNSSSLGWGESGILRSYAFCYELTGDTHWLDKIAEHFENIIETSTDEDGDGYRSWVTKRYSAVPWTASARAGNTGNASISPAEGIVRKADCWKEVNGQTFTITFLPEGAIKVTDSSKDAPLIESAPFAPGKNVPGIPLIAVKIEGAPKPGDAFEVHTVPADALDYVVHQGMFLYPVALAMEIWAADPDLFARKREQFERFEAFIANTMLDRWTAEWVDVPGTELGAYKFQDSHSQRYPDTVLPHNQFLAMARAFLVLSDIPRIERRAEYRDKARRMYLYFKHFLKEQNGAYLWNYWDIHPELPNPYGARSNPEDYSHAGLTMGCCLEAARRGFLFDDEDMRRFASTFVDVMWNGDEDKPRVGARVDTNEGDKVIYGDWALLSQWDPRVAPLITRMFEDASSSQASLLPRIAVCERRAVRQ